MRNLLTLSRWESNLALTLFLAPLCTFLLSAAPAIGQIDVWVDPGHCCGGEPGALGFNGAAPPNEKDLTLAVANYLQGDLLSLGYFAYKTVNHPTTFLTPEDRSRIANGVLANDDADQGVPYLFVSVHMNSAPNSSAKGTETYHSIRKSRAIDTKAYRADSTAAQYIHPDLMANANVAFLGCSQDRGIKINDKLIVCRYSYPPAVLVEVCFISNSCQWGNIITAGDQALVADGIAAGVSGYLGALVRNVPYDVVVEGPNFEESLLPISTPRLTSRPAPQATLQEGFEVGAFPPTGWTTQTAGLALRTNGTARATHLTLVPAPSPR